MKINRDMVTRAGLKLLNEEGLEQLTLRRLGTELDVRPATIYWHFKSKEELLDEMATTVLTEGAANLLPEGIPPIGESGLPPSAKACARPSWPTATAPTWWPEPG